MHFEMVVVHGSWLAHLLLRWGVTGGPLGLQREWWAVREAGDVGLGESESGWGALWVW